MTNVSTEIDITGIDHVKLLQALYRNTHSFGMGAFKNIESGELPVHLAERALKVGVEAHLGRVKFDWVEGRPIKVAIVGNTLTHVWLYDRDAGEGACQRAVDEARKATLEAGSET